eukprot:TRINITY_DN4968_c0_g1_i1.p1 TRINITY_DN4968_c0_g1~~TRINITY_DN4968_c0_g1_i1.p1  ORF type:complete len:143 (+),score=28.26 TRINITY_DN4968_c0_g1_i1:276-704(+)
MLDTFGISQWRQIGLMISGLGLFFLFFGTVMFLDRALLAFGNLLFLVGLALVIGLQKTMVFFFQPRKMKGTCLFLGGIFLVLIKWPLIGMLLEVYGLFLLFGDFFPVVVSYMRMLPIIGSILELPFLRSVVDRITDQNTLPV